MQIEIKCECGENCKEWAIVELQGIVEIQPDYQHTFQNLHIGRLCRPSSQEVYTFTVGYHELTGSKVALKKPLLVLKKTKKPSPIEGESSSDVELEVIGVVRHRILFKTRPRAIISKPQLSAKERAKIKEVDSMEVVEDQ